MRATQYLPGIVKLQYQMYKHSHRRWDKNDVVQYTIGEFIRGLGKGITVTYFVIINKLTDNMQDIMLNRKGAIFVRNLTVLEMPGV